MTYYASYGQVGFRLSERLSAHVQAELSRVHHADDEGVLKFRHTRDLAGAVNFKVTRAMVLKGEGHLQRGHAFDTFVDPVGPSVFSKYFIASVSVAF